MALFSFLRRLGFGEAKPRGTSTAAAGITRRAPRPPPVKTKRDDGAPPGPQGVCHARKKQQLIPTPPGSRPGRAAPPPMGGFCKYG